nr:hypothetical protein FFPRI1PSEUD_03480 [Pseudomonas sp. FFPRI_1]
MSVTAKVEGAPVGQLQADGSGRTGVDLVPHEQTITFDKDTPDSFRRYHKNLTDNAFDDGNNTAHWGLSGVPLSRLPCTGLGAGRNSVWTYIAV